MRYLILAMVLALGCAEEQSADVGAIDLTPVDGALDSATDSGVVDAETTDMEPVGPADSAVPPDASGPSLPPCDIEGGTAPVEATILEFHDGEGVGDVARQGWMVIEREVATADLHESVVFELDRPARVFGFAIQYGTLPEHPDTVLSASLHPDFGYNGFDFWAKDHLATSSRCRRDVVEGEWAEFILEEAVELADPGLVHVAHLREEGGAAWLFDGTPPNADCTDDCCSPFGACRSAWNFPRWRFFDAGGQQNYAYNGLSLTFRYDYLVRLYVEYTDEVQPEEEAFVRIEDLELSNRLAWADYDNDGDEDLLVNGPRLLRNDGDGFVDVTEAAGLGLDDVIGSGVFGDYDNDGCLDVFIFDEAYDRSDHLLRSDCEGGFVDVTEAAGFNDVVEYMSCDGQDRAPTPAAAWVDMDADGFLDLYLANFICWSSGESYLDTVWRSLGDGRFEEWTGRQGFASLEDEDVRLASRGALPADFDGDGDVDILANTYRLNRNLYYRNEGGTFTEMGAEAGLTGRRTPIGDDSAYYGHAIGAAVGDLDGDADLDLVVANLAHPRFFDFSSKTEVLINQGDGSFEDIQGSWRYPVGAAGIRYQETHSIPTLGDFDNDGHLDLVISAIYDGRPSDFYWGNGDGSFELDTWRSGIDVMNGWGQAAADFDRDGRLDLATSHGLFRNQSGGQGAWLQTRVVGNVTSNRAGIGATVYVETTEGTFVRVIEGGTGQGCQNSLSPHFGLAESVAVERVRVRFPGSAEDVLYLGPFAVNQRLWLYEDGTHAEGWQADW